MGLEIEALKSKAGDTASLNQSPAPYTTSTELARDCIDLISTSSTSSLRKANYFLNKALGSTSANHTSQVSANPSEFMLMELESGIVKKGLQEDLTKEQIDKLLNSYASVIETSETDTVYKLKTGEHVKVSHITNGQIDRINFLYMNNNGTTNQHANASFMDILKKEEATEIVFRRNPYFNTELAVQAKQQSAQPATTIERIQLDKIHDSEHKVLMIPDSHGDMSRLQYLRESITSKSYDWVALEMIPHTLQATVSQFIDEPTGSESYNSARQNLLEYFNSHWNNKFKEQASPEDNPYFQILELAKKERVQVYAIDTDLDYYAMNPQQDPLIVGTRNKVWADSVPKSGKGIMFGGLAHFHWNKGIAVQDFLAERRSYKEMIMVDFDDK